MNDITKVINDMMIYINNAYKSINEISSSLSLTSEKSISINNNINNLVDVSNNVDTVTEEIGSILK